METLEEVAEEYVPLPKPVEPFSVADHLSDVVLVVEDKPIHFNKAFLSACSPVFDRMFHGDFAEKSSKEILLPDKRYEDMITFLKLIHPAHAHSTFITDKNIVILLDLCREYQVESVRNKCEQYIDNEIQLRAVRKLTADRLLLFLYACDQYGLQIKQLKSLKALAHAQERRSFKASNNFKEFGSTPSFIEAMDRRFDTVDFVLAEIKQVLQNHNWCLPSQRGGPRCKCKYSYDEFGQSRFDELCEHCGLVEMGDELYAQLKKMEQ